MQTGPFWLFSISLSFREAERGELQRGQGGNVVHTPTLSSLLFPSLAGLRSIDESGRDKCLLFIVSHTTRPKSMVVLLGGSGQERAMTRGHFSCFFSLRLGRWEALGIRRQGCIIDARVARFLTGKRRITADFPQQIRSFTVSILNNCYGGVY